MDDNNISSFSNNSNNNKYNPEEDRELFSYDNSSNLSGSDSVSFDLNSFSSKKEGTPSAKPKKTRKSKNLKKSILKGVLTVFLVGIITVSIVVGGFMFYAFTMVDGTMDEDLENSLNYTTTIYVDDDNGGYKEYRRLHGEFNRIWVDYDKVAIDNKDEGYDGLIIALTKLKESITNE